jgi:hypothetical protein
MTYRCELTTDWTPEQFRQHEAEITACLKRYVDEYPEFETLRNIVEEIARGERQLWVIFNGDEIKSALVTEIEIVKATGKKVCRFAIMGGHEGIEAVPAMSEAVESWAKTQGAEFAEIFGRRGWGRVFKDFHYHEEKAIFRKALK